MNNADKRKWERVVMVQSDRKSLEVESNRDADENEENERRGWGY